MYEIGDKVRILFGPSKDEIGVITLVFEDYDKGPQHSRYLILLDSGGETDCAGVDLAAVI